MFDFLKVTLLGIFFILPWLLYLWVIISIIYIFSTTAAIIFGVGILVISIAKAAWDLRPFFS